MGWKLNLKRWYWSIVLQNEEVCDATKVQRSTNAQYT